MAFVCIFCGLCSVSAYASDIDFSINGESYELELNVDGVETLADVTGYTITPVYSTPTHGNTGFEGIIKETKPHGSVNITYVLKLAEPLKRNSTFDIGLKFTGGSFGGMTASLMMFDQEYINALGSGMSVEGEVIANKKRIEFFEVCNTRRDCKYIEIYINVQSPQWETKNVDTSQLGFFSLYSERDGSFIGRFYFDEGMTFETWFTQIYNTAFTVYNPWSNIVSLGNEKVPNGAMLMTGRYDSINPDNSYFDSVSVNDIIKSQNYYICTDSSNITVRNLVSYEFVFLLQALTINELEDDELSGGILGWIKNIFSGITSIPSKIASNISIFFTELGNKVSNLGTTILDGIKGLFVPSSEDITKFKIDLEQLLAERFGAVYESTQIIDNFANALFNQANALISEEEQGNINKVATNQVVVVDDILVFEDGVYSNSLYDIELVPNCQYFLEISELGSQDTMSVIGSCIYVPGDGMDTIDQLYVDFIVFQNDDMTVSFRLFKWPEKLFSQVGYWSFCSMINGNLNPSEGTFDVKIVSLDTGAVTPDLGDDDSDSDTSNGNNTGYIETVYFPLLSVPLAGAQFTFGGWDVDIIPNGFEDIVEVIKIVVDIGVTFMFINAMRKRLDEVLR